MSEENSEFFVDKQRSGYEPEVELSSSHDEEEAELSNRTGEDWNDNDNNSGSKNNKSPKLNRGQELDTSELGLEITKNEQVHRETILQGTNNDDDDDNDDDDNDDDDNDDDDDDDDDDIVSTSSSDSLTSSEDETEPPRLKYSRITKLPSNFFHKDPISTSLFSENYFIFATHSGMIYICKPDFEPIRTLKAHRASVLSLYTDGKFFASASMDGTVLIGSITDVDDIIAYDFHRPVHCIILLENYASKRSFITGGMSGEIIFSTKGWLGKKTDYIYAKGTESSGPIVGLYNIGDDLIIWMNDEGIHIFQLSNRKLIKILEKPKDSPRSDLYWPKLIVEDPDRVVIVWSNYIWSLRVSIRQKDEKEGESLSSSSAAGAVQPLPPLQQQQQQSSAMSRILPSTASISFRSVQEKKIEIEHIFKLEDLICGIASFKDDLWMILTYIPPTPTQGKPLYHNPEIKLINSMTGEVEFEQELGLRDVANLGLNDFKLGFHNETVAKYYIISAKDGVIAEEYQLDDRLQWYLDKENYFKAWELGQHLVSPEKCLSYGVQYVDLLIKDNEWMKAGDFLIDLLPFRESYREDGLSMGSDKEGEEAEDIVKEKNKEKDQQQQQQEEEEEEGKENDDENENAKGGKEWINQWESWAYIFIDSGHIKELTKVIPQSQLLSTEIFTKILMYWTNTDLKKTCALINEWDLQLYDLEFIQAKLESRASQYHDGHGDGSNDDDDDDDAVVVVDRDLEECLVSLYEKSMQYYKAIPHLVNLKDKHIVSYLDKNHILSKFISQLPKYIELALGDKTDIKNLYILPINNQSRPEALDEQEAIIQQLQPKLTPIVNVLINHRLEISPHEIVSLFKESKLPIMNYLYLAKLKTVDELQIQDFGNEMVELYANFNRSLLFPYLSHNENYNVDEAIEVCQSKELYSELIYLLGKIGENKKAINLVIHKLNDAKLVIEFASRLKDQDTWNMVLLESMSRPHFIKQLITQCDADESLGQFYNPITILSKMDKLETSDDESLMRLLKNSIVEFDSRNQLNKLINQILLNMILKQSCGIAHFLKSSLLKGIEVEFEEEALDRKEWDEIIQKYEPIVL
ncbi:VPS41 [Candida oxycetoniae]|uniref:VPS41 n=1 Tax=Candida oxycetoniae TaxID=497107 RepID=A0AAI9SU97_9ASCO|nr:VPS41 [Candida oxycetoniae]KAI3403000.2 VPS41 [Candida oxycetoniae]